MQFCYIYNFGKLAGPQNHPILSVQDTWVSTISQWYLHFSQDLGVGQKGTEDTQKVSWH
jgi:hypothetical protein